jgi:carbon storage regulator CsrA
MLVLSRKLGEEILISDNITVRLLQIGKGRVRLGIEAPPEISISRAESPPLTADDPRPVGCLQSTATA